MRGRPRYLETLTRNPGIQLLSPLPSSTASQGQSACTGVFCAWTYTHSITHINLKPLLDAQPQTIPTP